MRECPQEGYPTGAFSQGEKNVWKKNSNPKTGRRDREEFCSLTRGMTKRKDAEMRASVRKGGIFQRALNEPHEELSGWSAVQIAPT